MSAGDGVLWGTATLILDCRGFAGLTCACRYGLAKHYETGEPLPEEPYQRLLAARTYRAGSMTLRQVWGWVGWHGWAWRPLCVLCGVEAGRKPCDVLGLPPHGLHSVSAGPAGTSGICLPAPCSLHSSPHACVTLILPACPLLQVHFASLDLELHSRFTPGHGESVFDRDQAVAKRTTVMPPLPEDRWVAGWLGWWVLGRPLGGLRLPVCPAMLGR